MNLCDIRTIKDTMAMFGLTFRKEFGQNFLTDGDVVASIAEACRGADTKTVLEIGAGVGAGAGATGFGAATDCAAALRLKSELATVCVTSTGLLARPLL